MGERRCATFPRRTGTAARPSARLRAPRQGVMLFKSNAPLSAAAMNARLLAMAKEQGRDVYAVETLGGELAPRLLYLVHPDGSRQLVRGAVFDELDNRSLRSEIVAAGDDEYVSNTLGAGPGDDHRAKPSLRRHQRQTRHRRAAEAALLSAPRARSIRRAGTRKVSLGPGSS